MRFRHLIAGLALLAAFTVRSAGAQTPPPVGTPTLSVTLTYLEKRADHPPPLSNLDPVPDDLGLAGARLGVRDSLTTGRFLGHGYSLDEVIVAPDEDFLAAGRAALTRSRLLVVNAPAADLSALAALPEAASAVLINAAAPDDSLRGAACRANLLHSIPSLAMRADALAQFLKWRRWSRAALITGPQPADQAFAVALRRALRKFGLKLVGEKPWPFDSDMRRSAAQEAPLFTQDLPEHDVLLIADESDDFGRYLLYTAWSPRPVAGSEGLSPQAWAEGVEAFGAVQLQNRFKSQAGRTMRPIDYAAWAAVRAISEAVTRTGSADPTALRARLLAPDFDLAAFKGRPLSFRSWDGQLRQPIPLAHPRAMVAMAPLDGFLHRRTELDTLGVDEPESACVAFKSALPPRT